MHVLYACVVHEHDLNLLALAALVCLVGVYSTVPLAVHAYRCQRRRRRLFWGGACALGMSGSAWATHFIAMLAFRPGAVAAFEPILTATSFVVAVSMIGAGIALSISTDRTLDRALGGGVVGLGIGAMHYVGIAAYEVTGTVRWNLLGVLVSIAAGVAL